MVKVSINLERTSAARPQAWEWRQRPSSCEVTELTCSLQGVYNNNTPFKCLEESGVYFWNSN